MRYWKRIDENKQITTVESNSHDLDLTPKGLIEISESEYEAYIGSLTPSQEPPSYKDLLILEKSAKVVDVKSTKQKQLESMIKYKKAKTNSEKIQVIAERLGLV